MRNGLRLLKLVGWGFFGVIVLSLLHLDALLLGIPFLAIVFLIVRGAASAVRGR